MGTLTDSILTVGLKINYFPEKRMIIITVIPNWEWCVLLNVIYVCMKFCKESECSVLSSTIRPVTRMRFHLKTERLLLTQ